MLLALHHKLMFLCRVYNVAIKDAELERLQGSIDFISRTRHLYILICQLEFNAVYPWAIWVYSWAKRADDIMVDDTVI